MKKRKLLCLGVMSFVFFDLSNIKKSKNIRIDLNNQSVKFSNKVDEATVFDYVDVLNTYYELAIGDTKQPTKTFEQFYDSYYSESSNRNLYDFTLDLAKENNNYTDVYLVLTNGSSNNISPASSGGNSGGGSTLDDAKNWKNLSDVKNIVIYSNSYETVDIKENWFATSIATSYVKGNYRIITYANNLSNDTLVSYENVIKK